MNFVKTLVFGLALLPLANCKHAENSSDLESRKQGKPDPGFQNAQADKAAFNAAMQKPTLQITCWRNKALDEVDLIAHFPDVKAPGGPVFFDVLVSDQTLKGREISSKVYNTGKILNWKTTNGISFALDPNFTDDNLKFIVNSAATSAQVDVSFAFANDFIGHYDTSFKNCETKICPKGVDLSSTRQIGCNR